MINLDLSRLEHFLGQCMSMLISKYSMEHLGPIGPLTCEASHRRPVARFADTCHVWPVWPVWPPTVAAEVCCARGVSTNLGCCKLWSRLWARNVPRIKSWWWLQPGTPHGNMLIWDHFRMEKKTLGMCLRNFQANLETLICWAIKWYFPWYFDAWTISVEEP